MGITQHQPVEDRHGIGGNAPPLDETIVIEFNEAIAELQGKIGDLVAAGDRAVAINKGDDITAGKYGDFIRMVGAAETKVDAARVQIKAPYLAATRALDGTAKATLDRLADAKAKVKRLLDTFVAAEAAERRAEHERNLAAQRALQAEADQRRRDEEAAGAPISEPEPEPVRVAPKPEPVVVRSDLGSRVGTKTVWSAKIDSIRKLPNAILNHPTVMEAALKVVTARVRGGEREIAGCTITEEQVANVR